ncbi:hypothetical protein [Pseudomonas akapageensis]|uniref:hypothetical protein n=1 Tax=Pseudomonas akapageensis TaxID=2609961 RepID=UPI00140C1673|nr:hypothetical protein [Pseudomonas akapageensis]
MQHKLSHITAVIVLTTAIQGSATAALYAVDPGPYNPQIGEFASWYQDSHGRTLDLCLSRNVSSRVAGAPGAPAYMCTLAVAPGIFDDTQDLVFPTNFPDEAFWFMGDASITDAASGINLTYVSAIEAAFSGGDPKEGDQISFARIRIRVDVPTPGIYTITHPYGVDVFDVTQADFTDTGGRKAINMTRDVGIGAAKTYNGALQGDIGPFLRSIRGPYVEANPDGGSDTFIGDPNLLEPVTGSPFNTNFVRVEGPNGINVSTNLFAVTGKLSQVTLPTPLITQRATYSRRNGSGSGSVIAQQDVFMQAPPPPGLADFVSNGQTTAMIESNATGNWYGQTALNPSVPVDLQLTADNRPAILTSTPTTVSVPLVDQVTIQTAEWHAGTLKVEATTSDETAPVTLTAFTGNGALILEMSGDGASKQMSTPSPIPPARVEVKSSNGGTDTEEVVLVP